MKIVHIAPKAPYNNYWGYQDNLLPKYQRKLGHDVTMIVTNTMHKDGKIIETECSDYVLNDGVRVIRLKVRDYGNPVLTNQMAKLPVYKYLEELRPDFIFYHSLHGLTIFDAIKYKKKINRECVIVQDNHMDYNNNNAPAGMKGQLCRCFQRWINRKSVPYVSKVYGVTPWRKTFAEDYYRIPKTKTDVLIMGADDEYLDLEHRDLYRKEIRERYGFADDDFVIVTGGRIDKAKNIDTLIKVCARLRNNIKLLVFGSVSPDFKAEFEKAQSGADNIIYIGWIYANKVYPYFFAADLIVFPGGHSVMWEQACASKTPCVFNYWDGMEHLNNGGNCICTSLKTEDEISSVIQELSQTDAYEKMKEAALSEKTDIFRYSEIAKKSLECAKIRKQTK